VGSPGPGGGYALTRPPSEITLQEVYDVFERDDVSHLCPFGGGVCGVGEPCAIHDKLVSMQAATRNFLGDNTFEMFRAAAQDKGLRPTPKDVIPETPRASYRAVQPRKR
jgi:DNA-binding IscR family transcriptional regulator